MSTRHVAGEVGARPRVPHRLESLASASALSPRTGADDSEHGRTGQEAASGKPVPISRPLQPPPKQERGLQREKYGAQEGVISGARRRRRLTNDLRQECMRSARALEWFATPTCRPEAEAFVVFKREDSCECIERVVRDVAMRTRDGRRNRRTMVLVSN